MASKFKKVRRTKNKSVDLDITSLMDIITILLVFLIQSYNVTDLKLDIVSGVTLPDSFSKTYGSDAIIIQVNKNRQVYVDNKHIGTINGDSENIPFLNEVLGQYKKEKLISENNKNKREPASNDLEKNEKKISANLVFDKGLPYKVVRQIMNTTALAGFAEFKFIVQAK